MHDDTSTDKRERILEAVLAVLARDGISGVTMRAVAREAEVALGLATTFASTAEHVHSTRKVNFFLLLLLPVLPFKRTSNFFIT